MGIRTELGLRLVAAALLAGVAAWVFLAFFYAEDQDDDQPERPGPDGPAAWEIAQLMEEARRITREAPQ